MKKQDFYNKCNNYLKKFCADIAERCVGSEGNRKATAFFKNELISLGWDTKTSEFSAMDWVDGGATLITDNADFKVSVSPYSLGCTVNAQLAGADNVGELENGNFQNKILLLYGDIAKEQLMPKNFAFYNPKEHQHIISLLEKSRARALICATGRNAALAGGAYPFPLIEDGDFNIPSVYMTEEEGKRLITQIGKEVTLNSVSERIPGISYNVIGKMGQNDSKRIVVTAHIDAKKGTPGAIDNATGICVLLLLAELLQNYSGTREIELVALNGEDYFSAPGQMNYIATNRDSFDNIVLNINIDGAGYKIGRSTFSFFNLPDTLLNSAKAVIRKHPEIVEGEPWPQGDHSIFVQYGRPAIAVSSQWFTENIDSQDITHTLKDNMGIVDCNKLIDITEAISDFIVTL